jgi:small nuclear ribonucleoprotein (snRNP)-like protein
MIGKEVFISLRSGKTYQGRIKAVGDHFLHLERIAGKDFYDALIRIEDISAVEAKFRGMQ